jgi:archaellum biogenesis ATPase FlaH
MKKIVQSGIKVIDRTVGGLPSPSLILVLIDPLATPELLIYDMCDYYVPSVKSKDIVENEIKTLGCDVKVIDFSKVKDLKDVRVCIEFTAGVDLAVELKELANSNNLVINLIVLKDFFDDKVLTQLKFVCDGVMVIEAEKIGERYVFRFAIPKMIGGYSIPNYIRFKTERSVLEIDTSRDIV